jgi:hypothetical protein
MTEAVYINGVPASSLGLVVSSIDPWSSGVAFDRDAFSLPGTWGLSESPTRTARARVIRFVGSLTGVSIAERDEAIQRVEEALEGLVEITFGDQEGKRLLGRRGSLVARPHVEAVAFAVGDMDLEVEIVCNQPFKFDADVTRLALGTFRTPIPVGTLPSAGIVFLPGPWTTRTLILRDTGGVEVDRLTIARSVLDTETVRVDLWKRTAHRITSAGVETNVISGIASGTGFFEIDPLRCRANRVAGSFPTLELSAGAGYVDTRRIWSN